MDFNIIKYLETFSLNEKRSKKPTQINYVIIHGYKIPKLINEFWTSKQRQSSSIHEISYRACFKAELPHFFIQILSNQGDIIYDPFSGRGTTVIEAALMNREIISNDINPLSKILAQPRFMIPSLSEIQERLDNIIFNEKISEDLDLSMFYHPKTEAELYSLKNYLKARKLEEKEDNIDRWIRMIATNRLTGHSSGFFSVYTLPPNQAVTQESQIKINLKRKQKPSYRNVKLLIVKKSKSLLKKLNDQQIATLNKIGLNAKFLSKDARKTHEIMNDSINLIVTSPPFLNIVQYSKDNWVRCWFNSIDADEIAKKITMSRSVDEWTSFMKEVFQEFFRIVKLNGWVVFEVGEIRKGKIKLDEVIVPIGIDSGFECKCILINSQKFTKTSNIWGIDNNKIGTNTNRIVIFKKIHE